MRLIDADGLLKNEAYFADRDFINSKYDDTLRDIVMRQPVIEQKHGHWEDLNDCDEIYGDLYKCPFCECVIVSGGIGGKPDNYCSHCGAKMNEVTE